MNRRLETESSFLPYDVLTGEGASSLRPIKPISVLRGAVIGGLLLTFGEPVFARSFDKKSGSSSGINNSNAPLVVEGEDLYKKHHENVYPHGDIIVEPLLVPGVAYEFEDIVKEDGSGSCDSGSFVPEGKGCLGYVEGPGFGPGTKVDGFIYDTFTGKYYLDETFVQPNSNGGEPPAFTPSGK